MLNKENTDKVLNAWGADIVKFAKINIGDRNRKRRSKITGKLRKGKIDSSGELRNSLNHEVETFANSFGFVINGADYANDIDQGTKRKTSVSQVKRWMKVKPVRLTSKKGFIKMTPSRVENFARFVAWKVSTIGSDATYYLTDAIKDASKKYEKELYDSLYKDIEQSTSAILRGLDNGNDNN
jgi:hypothetical protein